MASIDYIEAKKELENIFAKNDMGYRKIIFWYDEPCNFKEDIVGDDFENCRVLINDKNDFAIKKIIEIEDTTSNILVYSSKERPEDEQNWLLDILMYSETYYADTVALTMRRLGLTNSDIRRDVARYAKFFDSDARVKKLKTYITINDSMNADNLKLAMMATLVKAAAPTIESVLIELVFDMQDKIAYSELTKYGFEEYFWNKISEYYNYNGELKIDRLIKNFMMTTIIEQKAEFSNLATAYSQYIIEGNGKTDAKFFIDKIKTDVRYENFQQAMAVELKIEELLIARAISDIKGADVFECIDIHIIQTIASSLANGSLDYDFFAKIISERVNSIWYKKHINEYEMLSSTIRFLIGADKHIKSEQTAEEYIKSYVEEYYKVDMEYRHCITNYKMIQEPLEVFDFLLERVEVLYENKFLSKLGKEFSDSLQKKNGVWEFSGLLQSKNFYAEIQKVNAKKMFVIISDALRYEIGYEICEAIKAHPILKGNASLDFAVSTLPSETRFGMAALLPSKTTEYNNKAVFVDKLPTDGVSNRNAILKSKNKNYQAIQFDEINGLKRDDLRSFMADKTLVYIYHNVIDKMGESNENKVFDVVKSAIDDIVNLIKKLYTNLQIANFRVTADHGFMYRKNKIDESQKYGDISHSKPLEMSKRYFITENTASRIPYTTEFKADVDGDYKVVSPYGYDIFKAQGGGIQYIHGGASLQEIIVPVIKISELRAKYKDAIGTVGVRLKSVIRKITNRSFTLDFEQYEKVEDKKSSITCLTYMIDENNERVSGEYKFVAASNSDDAYTRVTKIRFTLKNIQFQRNMRYFLVLQKADSNVVIEKVQFTIDILMFKPIFDGGGTNG